jgi:hypothetical protein
MGNARQIRIVIEALDRFASQIIRKLVLDIVANLQRSPGAGGTPVDTGWARANWIPVIGRASGKPTPAPGVSDAENRSAASQLSGQGQAAAAIIAATYSVSQGRVTIANNVPYILKLNEGSSTQAPRGFVQKAIVKAITFDLAKGLGVR